MACISLLFYTSLTLYLFSIILTESKQKQP